MNELLCKCYDTDKLDELEFEDSKSIKQFGVDDRQMEYVKLFHKFFDSNDELQNAYESMVMDIVKEHYKCDVYFQITPNIRLHQPESTSLGRRDIDPEGMIGYHSDNEFNHPKGEDNWIYAITDMFDSNSLYYGDYDDVHNVNLKQGEFASFDFNVIKHWNKINKTGKTRLSLDFRIMRTDVSPLKNNYYKYLVY